MKQSMNKILPILLLLASVCLTSCEKRNLRELVKEIAEAPVDTTGMRKTTILLNEFSAVYVDCFADVAFHQTAFTDTPYVKVMALPEVLDNVHVKVDKGELQVGINRRYRMPDNTVILVDVYAPFLNRVNTTGVKCFRLGNIVINSPLEVSCEGVGALIADTVCSPEFYLHTFGGASADLHGLQVQTMKLKQEDHSLIWLEGECHTLQMEAEQDSFVYITQLRVAE